MLARVFTTVAVHDGPRAAWLDRAFAASFFGAACAATAVLLRVTPDARGHGTHVQLGLGDCSFPSTYGIPCPTCGATTAACHLVHGEPLAAIATHPFGAAIALAGLIAGAAGAYCLLRGRSFLDLFMQLPRGKLLLAAVVLLLASWGYKCLTWSA